MSSEISVPPPVLWAQRKEDVFLTFSVETKDPTIKIEKDSVYFRGEGAPDNRLHEVTIALYDTVLPEKSVFVNKGRCVEMILRKEKTDGPFWPTLTKDKKKPHYLKIDFNKWNDEDDEVEENNSYDFEQMLQNFGGAGGPGQKAEKPSFDDLETDSDDENLPDLE
ncbi:uncharacterized protein CG16817-like [Bombyx mandarina]|uniref:p23-like protein n=2 Tax=Bombyx TaxID=7090 RepID=Q5CCL6_BOMMO|nr:p23-like protein [Bombyx mori]XP_028030180.1 uncharacterized protein CG16817-like [Bombyx mandarina]BAD90845.1 p23-like protein [Bombyx mori]